MNKFLVIALLAIGGYYLGTIAYDKAKIVASRVEQTQVKVENLADAATATFESARSTSESSRLMVDEFRKVVADLTRRLSLAEGENAELQANMALMASANDTKIAELQASLAAATAPPKSPKIVMHSGPNCAVCLTWKANNKPAWEKQGWKVEVVEETTTDRGWPWFEVCENDKCYIVQGPLTIESLQKAKGQ